ncbi:MAG: hypothetical protein KIS94_04225 [Chitinophagales bacterium]|nr:hypothetical protein [Chitinophagales bacterium]
MRPNVSELLEKINRFARQSQLSQLELDLLKSYLREMYEALDDAAIMQTEEAPVIPLKVEKAETLQPELLVADKEQPTEQKPMDVKPEKIVNKVEELQAKQVAETQKEMLTSVKASINEIVKPAQTLNEKVKGKPVEVHHRFASKALKDMVDLNKRFVFVSELFKGDADGFSEAVKYIDSLETYNTAQQYLAETLLRKYGWDETSQAARLFNKMVKQKFGEE